MKYIRYRELIIYNCVEVAESAKDYLAEKEA